MNSKPGVRQIACPRCAAAIPVGDASGVHPTVSPAKEANGTLKVAEDVARTTPHLGPAVPGYEILGELGRGGMGVVYKARQVGLNRLVALKMILAGGHAGPKEVARFRTEAEAVARLQHPNIVQVFEVGEAGGHPYLALEYCPGGSLHDRLRGKVLPPAKAARLVEILALTVAVAHDAGVVHRDLKPANILIGSDGQQKVTDFGLAKRLDGKGGQTSTGAVMGTPC